MTNLAQRSRGLNPGDTGRSVHVGPPQLLTLKRRPGPQPRRHLPPRVRWAHCIRSTKAGASTPATLEAVTLEHDAEVGRSTKAGASTPATRRTPRRCARRTSALNEGRGLNPATHIDLAHENTASPAQRRPGPQPRRHVAVGVQPGRHLLARSTKAGASTPATRGWTSARGTAAAPLNEAGASTPATPIEHGVDPHVNALAQRRPGPQPRRTLDEHLQLEDEHHRSTKAGASTPATLSSRITVA